MKKENWFKTLIFTGIILGIISLIPTQYTSIFTVNIIREDYGPYYDVLLSPFGFYRIEFTGGAPYVYYEILMVSYYQVPAILMVLGLILLATTIITTSMKNTTMKRTLKRLNKTGYAGSILLALGPICTMIFMMGELSLEEPRFPIMLPGFSTSYVDLYPWSFFYGKCEGGYYSSDFIYTWYASGGFYMPLAGATLGLVGSPLLGIHIKHNFRPPKPPASTQLEAFEDPFGGFQST